MGSEAVHVSALGAIRSDAALVRELRAGNEAVFAAVVGEYSALMQRVAALYVRDREVVAEVVQETWVGVICGLGRFEGRASFRTWVLRVLTNIARTRAVREARSVPFATLARGELGDAEAAVDADCFQPAGHEWVGHWIVPPASFTALPEERVAGAETIGVARAAIDELPPAQRAVITMRDVVGFSAEEVCAELEISAGNQRVLLHRARSQVRRALEAHLSAVGG